MNLPFPGRFVQVALVAAGIERKEAAAAMGYSESYLSAAINGKKPFSMDAIWNIALVDMNTKPGDPLRAPIFGRSLMEQVLCEQRLGSVIRDFRTFAVHFFTE